MAYTLTYETGFSTTLAAKLNPADTTATLATVPTRTAGRMFLKNGTTKEWISYTGVSGSTITGLTRSLSKTADPASGTTGLTWVAGTPITLVAMHDQLIDKQQGVVFDSDTIAGLNANNLTTAQRVTVTAQNGDIVYDTDLGELYQYIAGAWSAVSAGSTQPNASLTVAGKVEIGTQAQVNAGTDTGETGAYTVVIPSTFLAGVTALQATEAQAELGTGNVTLMTPLRSRQADNVIVLVAGEDITAGNAVYIKLSDSKAWKSDANVNNATEFVGFAINTALTAANVYVKTAGVFVTTGLTANSDYFLSDTAGAIALTVGTNPFRVGTAISTTELVIDARTIVPVACTIANANTVDSFASAGTSYIKYKEITIPQSGTYITSCTMANGDGGGGSTDSCRIYKNGVAYGTENSIIGGGTTPVTYVENLAFLKGDLIQLYAKMSVSGPGTHTVSSLAIS